MFRIGQSINFLVVLVLLSTAHAGIKFSDRVEEYRLENGLKVILIEDNRSPQL